MRRAVALSIATFLAAASAALLPSHGAFAGSRLSTTAASFGPIKTGDSMPAFAGYNLDGALVRSTSLTENGGGVVVRFFTSWSAPCKVGMPIIEKEVSKHKDWKTIFVSVGEEEASVMRMIRSMGLQSTVLLDTHGRIAARFGVGGSLPKTFIVGPSGKVGTIFNEEGEDLQSVLEMAINTAE